MAEQKTMIDTRATIERLRALLEKATPGEWHAVDKAYGELSEQEMQSEEDLSHLSMHKSRHHTVSRSPNVNGWRTDGGNDDYCISEEDAALIAEAHNALPALLDRLEKLERVAEAAKRLTNSVDKTSGLTTLLTRDISKLEIALNELAK
jgi:hypothetical protein